ncbi:MAG: tetratricopeptide repeat protein [Chitinivibrionales bacterium]
MQPFTYEDLSLALAGNDMEKLKEARKNCRAILKNKPNDSAFLHLMAIIEFKFGHIDAASECIKKAIAISPNSAELYCNYAKMLASRKKYADAVIAFRRSIALKPDFAPAFYGLGTVFKESGDDSNAIKAYNDALGIDPNYPEVLNNLGLILKEKGELAGAINCYDRAIVARPEYPMPLNNLGVVWFSLGQVDAAECLFRRALALQPDNPDTLNNLGSIPLHHGRFEESMVFFKKALTLRPEHPDALNNLGNALKNIGKMPEAIAAYEQAIAIKPDCPDYHNNLAMAFLACGRFIEGWRDYEWRWKTAQFSGIRQNATKPLWKGEKAQGRIVLVRAEQGFGDTIQFCRYAPLASAYGLRVLMEVQQPLVKIMGSLAGVECVVAQGLSLPEHDFYCPMMSLPLAFNTRLETIPAHVPYLSAEHDSVIKWKKHFLIGADKRLNVGLAWAGKPRIQSPDLIAADRRRSMSAELLARIMDIPGVRFYSLQKDGPPAPREFGLIDLMFECGDFADTAALIANLDLVISVDTAIAHLAGALGKPVWLLNRFDSCWRWLRDRQDSPWYPTMRVFHQPSPGDWKSVMSSVSDELRKIITKM